MLSLIITGLCSTNALAFNPDDWQAWSEVIESDESATMQDIYNLFDYPIDFLWGKEGGEKEATVQDFLFVLSQKSYINRVYDNQKYEFVYPAGDSIWMSAAEWSELNKDMNSDVPRDIVVEMDKRCKECKEILKANYVLQDATQFNDLLEKFCPDLLGLWQNNPKAAEYWAKEQTKLVIYNSGWTEIALHEMTHETNARQSGAFKSRKMVLDSNGVVGAISGLVYWNDKPTTMHYYDSMTGNTVSVKTNSVPKLTKLVHENDVPDEIRKTEYYKTYFKADSASEDWGIYGMLDEFCASIVTLRWSVVTGSFGYHASGFSESLLDEIWFWDGAIGAYLRGLEREKPEVYNKLMSDESLVQILSDCCSYINSQVALVNVTPTSGHNATTAALKKWSDEVGLKNLLAEVNDVTKSIAA